jgi:hypothetical protein
MCRADVPARLVVLVLCVADDTVRTEIPDKSMATHLNGLASSLLQGPKITTLISMTYDSEGAIRSVHARIHGSVVLGQHFLHGGPVYSTYNILQLPPPLAPLAESR